MINKHSTETVILVLFFLSGCLGLVYEVLWLKELKLLFGSSIQAASVTVAAFFLGISAGGFYWGRRASAINNLLRAYGLMEIAIGISAILYIVLFFGYQKIYGTLFDLFEGMPILFVFLKLVLAMTMLFLPAFFMGGTLPVLGQFFVRQPEQLGVKGTFLYALNTAGAVLGVLLAGFVLPQSLGYSQSYFAAIAFSVLIGMTALWAGQGSGLPKAAKAPGGEQQPKAALLSPLLHNPVLLIMSFLSGFLALNMQIFWTRMFSQVLQNTVYSFSVILMIFLTALALGAMLANRLSKKSLAPYNVMAVLSTSAGIVCALTPALFMLITDGTRGILFFEKAAWPVYLCAVFVAAMLVIGVPGVFLGSLFPYLLKAAESIRDDAGKIIGRLMAINTIGAILGSLSGGFIFLAYVRLWPSIKWVSFGYLLVALIAVLTSKKRFLSKTAVFCFSGFAILAALVPIDYPLAYLEKGKDLKLLAVYEGPSAITSVIQHQSNSADSYLRMYLNNKYSPGGTQRSSVNAQIAQTGIPFMLQKQPASAFYLGMGTGITAGAVLTMKIEQVTVCELVPEVVKASKSFFSNYVFGLYDDPRVKLVIEDGRNYLLGKTNAYDLIIADLFLPWKAGIGNLYTVEHFQTIKSSLARDGIFAQWLALYQLSESELYTIIRTLLEVFDQVTLWRNSSSTTRPTLGLICKTTDRPLDTDVVAQNFNRNVGESPQLSANKFSSIFIMNYCGNISENKGLFASAPINTDNRPAIEFGSPKSYQNRVAGMEKAVTGNTLIAFFERLQKGCPLDRDPYLKQLGDIERKAVRTGLELYKKQISAKK